MITDDQLEELDTCGFDWGCYDREEKYAYARRAIALALQVKPLEWRNDSFGFKRIYAKTDFGLYEVTLCEEGYALFIQNLQIFGFDTKQKAIEAAQADFNKRVLGNLVHGESK